jgi:hypothetical protein
VNRPGFGAASFLAKDADRAPAGTLRSSGRATRMALDRLDESGSAWAVAQSLGPKLGVGQETLCKWVVQA